MKNYGGVEVQLHHYSPLHYVEMSGQLHAAVALPLRKEPPVPIGKEAGWAPEPVWTLWSREKPLTSDEI
jgi:hypothetical protein